MFSCVSDGKCIPDYFLCDHDRDCSDGSDEADCKFDACKSTEFKCNNGRCINRKWLCGMFLTENIFFVVDKMMPLSLEWGCFVSLF